MAIVIDAVIILIILFYALRCMKRGFVRTLLEFAGYIAAAAVAFSAAGYIAEDIYKKNIRPPVVEAIRESIGSAGEKLTKGNETRKLWKDLPEFVTIIARLSGKDENSFAESVNRQISNTASSTANAVAKNVVKPIAVSALKMLISTILFIVLLILVRWLARFINSLFNLPILKSFNRIFGFIFGLGKGVLITYFIVTLIRMAFPLFGGEIWIITPELIDETYIARWMFNFIIF